MVVTYLLVFVTILQEEKNKTLQIQKTQLIRDKHRMSTTLYEQHRHFTNHSDTLRTSATHHEASKNLNGTQYGNATFENYTYFIAYFPRCTLYLFERAINK